MNRTKQSNTYTLGPHGHSDGNRDGGGSSDSFEIMKDIETDMKNTRRLQELYNVKETGGTCSSLTSNDYRAEVVAQSKQRPVFARRFSAHAKSA